MYIYLYSLFLFIYIKHIHMCLDIYNKHSLEAKQVIYLKQTTLSRFMCPAMVKKKLRLEVPLALLRLGTDSLTETVTLDVGPREWLSRS